jgi:single-strand DNA-binding protein
MASLNKIQIIGHLGRDPEVRRLPNGDAVANFSVATTDKWKNQAGEPQEATEWHRVTAFAKLAEIVERYLKKGSQVYIEGKIQTRKYQDKDGNEKLSVEIRAAEMQMLDSRSDSGGQQQAPMQQRQAPAPQRQAAPAAAAGFDDDDDGIPF